MELNVRNRGQPWKTVYGIAALWALSALNAFAIVITYSRFPPEEFYHFSQNGLAGGLGRALVFANFPVALIAIAMIGTSLLALRTSPYRESPGHRRVIGLLAILAVAFCLMTAIPGVVNAGDLDARPVNVVPFIGVVIAFALSVPAIREGDWPASGAATWRDQVSIAIVAMLTFISLPWIVADLGFYMDDIPIIGRLFIASEVPAGETLAAVHLGHHLGLDGLVSVTSALVLNRLTRNRYVGALATALSVYLALLFTYGAFNLANDAWLEQIAKRGWAEWETPNVLTPGFSVIWGLIAIGTITVWFVLFRSGNSQSVPAIAAPPKAARTRNEGR